ncbi:MAG: Arc family DNA-binding protein [Bacteroidales bacterium]|nr:Arc family DNA-binding protein [Bacteroidales bacterium]
MKKSFALRVDAEIFEALERWAADEFRSVNGQIEWILATSLKKVGRMPKKAKEKPSEEESARA